MKDARPTSGKVMLALFSIIGELDGNKKFLDLFSGTGRIGIEAIKRGSGQVVFVESVKQRAEEIKEEIKKIIPENPEKNIVLSLEVRRALNWLAKRELKFDFIFADPPYNSGWCKILPELKNLEKIFSDDCIFIIEHSTREKFNLNEKNNPYGLEIFLEKIYGETCLTFLKKSEY